MTFFSKSASSPLPHSLFHAHLAAIFFWGAVYIYLPILSPYIQKISGSYKAVGLVIGAYGLAQLVLRIPLGIWSDHLQRRKPFILFGFFFEALAAIGLLLSANTPMLFISVFIAGIAASMWVPFTVLFASYFPEEKLAYSMSLLLFSTRISQVITNYAGGVVAEVYNWSGPFYLGIMLAGIGLFLARGLAEPCLKRPPLPSLKEFFMVGRNPALLRPSLAGVVLQFAIFSCPIGFTPLYAQQLGASKAQLGILLFSYQLPNTLATLLSGTFFQIYLSPRLLLFSGFLLVSGSLALLPLSKEITILYGVQALNGWGVGLIFPLLMSLALQVTPVGQRATAMGFFQSLYALGMTAGPIISGLLAQHFGLYTVFMFNGILSFFAGLLSIKK